MNIELLEKVKQYILAEPRRLDMDELGRKVHANQQSPPCGTVGCIAGWAGILSLPEIPAEITFALVESRMNWGVGEQELLLAPDEAQRLFSEPRNARKCNKWPKQFADAYVAATTPTERATITAARIDHFIATDGRE